jgi:hypothetical protein
MIIAHETKNCKLLSKLKTLILFNNDNHIPDKLILYSLQ